MTGQSDTMLSYSEHFSHFAYCNKHFAFIFKTTMTQCACQNMFHSSELITCAINQEHHSSYYSHQLQSTKQFVTPFPYSSLNTCTNPIATITNNPSAIATITTSKRGVKSYLIYYYDITCSAIRHAHRPGTED